MKYEVKSINPTTAVNMLKKNTLNRQLSDSIVSEYSRQMTAGLWKEETGESIKIAIDGTILDGQHRLAAIVKSNITLLFLVISDLEKEVFTVLDSGKLRSAGDIFHIAGVTNANNTSAGIKKYVILKSGRISFNTNALKINYSKSELLSIYNSNKKFWDACVSMAEKWYGKFQRVISQSDIIGFYAIFYDIHPDDAFIFMDTLCSGDGLMANNPIKQLRDKLIFSKANKKFTINIALKIAFFYKAWNLYRDNKTVNYLKYNPEIDTFPVLR